ncbi:hypothetical protein [Plantactinospora endophytica]|uniref:SMI1/KNR4 family protein n=1 Tax=Plantactinospora endophytica TaxID=673535 RepID=A0ABQ4EBU0_9ACTN|nr:hypothetical protein [Plantactinospora endophytica]GIG92201.1 hypothetical protein Pen02_71370 [Plantactinospora endophytica]
MAESVGTGYDGLSSRLVPEIELRAFLLDCFGIDEPELFVGHADRTAEDLRNVPPDVVFAAFFTYWQVSGHFAMGFDLGIEGRLVDRVGRREFAERFAIRFDANVLYGDTEPPGLWTVILNDGSRVLAAMDEEDEQYLLYAATAPVPGLPEVRVREDLWQLR